MHVSKLFEFIQSDVPSNTLLYQMNSEHYSIWKIRRIRNTIFQEPIERETISHGY